MNMSSVPSKDMVSSVFCRGFLAWTYVFSGMIFADQQDEDDPDCCPSCYGLATTTYCGDEIPLKNTNAWSIRVNNAIAESGEDGLRIEVAPGRDWGIAVLPYVYFRYDTGRVRVRIRENSGGKWLLRVNRNLKETAQPRIWSIFERMSSAGEYDMPLDYRRVHPRLCDPTEYSLMNNVDTYDYLQVQVGVEGPPGSYVVVEAIEFLPPAREYNRQFQYHQYTIDCVAQMPNLPKPYCLKNWRQLARDYDRFIFDFDAKGEYLPFIWRDESYVNIEGPSFGLPSYAGDPRAGKDKPYQEAVTCLGAVLGATLAGIDKSQQVYNYVDMCEAWFNRRNGRNLVLDTMDQGTGGSFWYEIWPNMLYFMLADHYPNMKNQESILRTVADRWRDATAAMTGPDGKANFNHTAFNFDTMLPVDNGKWKEPDSAAGIAWLEYMAWTRFHDDTYLDAATKALDFLQECKENPYYELLLPYGALTAARMNGELGRNYSVNRFVEWCFGVSDCRGGWGVVTGTWGGYDCDGLVGSIDNIGGYAFAMNTFTQAAALVPLVRYDSIYANIIGKWMLNLANAARLFYADALPGDHQSSAFWTGDPDHLIPYEGLRCMWDGKSPYATGDPLAMTWGPATDRGLYGGSYVGLLGGLVKETDCPGVLEIDCCATDFFAPPSYPTRLYYNPYDHEVEIHIDVGENPVKIYHDFHTVYSGRIPIKLFPNAATTLVFYPADEDVVCEPPRVRSGSVIIEYSYRGIPFI